MLDLLANFKKTQDQINEACHKFSRNRNEITLVAISKKHSAHAIKQLAEYGQVDFGENYLQEFEEKKSALNLPNIRWHMTGKIQTRKASHIINKFALIHTLDSEKLADAIESRLKSGDDLQNVLIEINIANEPQKAGIVPEKAEELINHIQNNCSHIKVKGLMCLPPVLDAGEASRIWFNKLFRLKESLNKNCGLNMKELSMGMSGDFFAAIAEGATLIRIGSNIFGPRN